MGHEQFERLLPAFADGQIDPVSASEVRGHVSECENCRSWLETYALLHAAASGAGGETGPSHLSSQELCAFALAADTLSEAARKRAARHEQECQDCSAEIALVRAGVEEEDLRNLPIDHSRSWSSSWAPGLALAAVLLILVAVAILTEHRTPEPDHVTVRKGRLEIQESISAEHAINVERTVVAAGAGLILQSDTIAFGEGFAVEAEGALVVANRSSAKGG